MSDKRKARMIDANALKTSFEEDGHLSSYIEEFIDNAPTIDDEPVRHGHWIKVLGGNGLVSTIRCSECDNCDNSYYIPGNYCWFCGAKMDGGKDDENA